MKQGAYEIQTVASQKLSICPDNARKSSDAEQIEELTRDIRAKGIIYPLVGYQSGEQIFIVDGGRRLQAGKKAGLEDFPVLVFDHKPTTAEVLELQARIDFHRKSFSEIEQSDLLFRWNQEEKLTQSQLAERINKSQAWVAKRLKLQTLAPAVRELIQQRTLDADRGYLIAAAESDPARQMELASKAASLPRSVLRADIGRSKTTRKHKSSAKSARFMMPGGLSVDVAGPELSLKTVVEVIGETGRILRKALEEGIDVWTQVRVMRDRVKAKPQAQLNEQKGK